MSGLMSYILWRERLEPLYLCSQIIGRLGGRSYVLPGKYIYLQYIYLHTDPFNCLEPGTIIPRAV